MPTDNTRPRALGYFSLGLGAAQILMPGAVSRLVGLKGGSTSTTVVRAIGVRELAAGVGILTQSRPAFWLWARVAGDIMDIALTSAALADPRNARGRLAATLSSLAGVTAVDATSAQELSGADGERDAQRVVKAITIRRSPDDVYRFWRDFQNFPSFMSHLESVRVVDERRSHWTASGPAGRSVEWDAEITEDQPGQRIGWRSLPGAMVSNSGSVSFRAAPGGRGTEVRVEIEYAPPAGQLGSLVARLFGQEPRQQVQADLRKLKQVVETGEVIRSSATISGTHLLQRPAQPVDARTATEARS
jgi:uncharacterized membrane protein